MGNKEAKEPNPHSLRDNLIMIVLAVAFAWTMQAYIIKPYKIPSGSMRNTLQCSDRVLVDRLSAHWRNYHRGDIVVFHPPRQPGGAPLDANTMESLSHNDKGDIGQTYIKRLIGLPGDEVSVEKGVAYVNGKKLKENYLHPTANESQDWGPVFVPKGHYLMLGDNRAYSADGRYFGFTPKANVIGRAIFAYWPISHFGRLGHGDRSSDHPNDGAMC